MSETTVAKLKLFLQGEIDNVDEDTIEMYLEDAKNEIIEYGILATNSKFSYLQRLLTAHKMAVAGIVNIDTTDERVGDVGLSFSDRNSDRRELTSYEILYMQELQKVIGIARRCI